ncbi:hypothetical protein KPL71_007438 [Citrus sinensis]|nr:hypothetical protein KPL71_007438 [Citrus sinensis]
MVRQKRSKSLNPKFLFFAQSPSRFTKTRCTHKSQPQAQHTKVSLTDIHTTPPLSVPFMCPGIAASSRSGALLSVPFRRTAVSSVQAHCCQFRSSCCCRWLAASFDRWPQPHKFVPHQRKDLLLYNMDPRCTGEMFKHLEKQNELLTEIHRSMSHELHKLQVEEEMLMRKFYELMTAHGLTKKNEGSANASDDGEAGNSASLLCLPSNDQQ